MVGSLLQLNGEDLREVPHNRAVSAFHRCGDRITLLVEKGAEQRIRVSLSYYLVVCPFDHSYTKAFVITSCVLFVWNSLCIMS